MRRQVTAAAIGTLVVVVVIVGVIIGLGSKGSASPSATPVPTVGPVSTQTGPGHRHQAVRLDASLRQFVRGVCLDFAQGRSQPLENNLMYYQYNTEIYYSPFNLGDGSWALPTQLGSWMGSHVRCIRIGEPFSGHAVLATRGWSKPGGWGIIDLDVPPGKTGWRLNDFTFGSRQQVMGAFFANDHQSEAYRS